ncbi:MAG: DUF222 domain-containing protein [Actinomycetota bacterium]
MNDGALMGVSVDETDLIARADALHVAAGQTQRALLAVLAEIDRDGAWEGDGARDVAHWVSMRYGVSTWKAARWVAAGQALGRLPRIEEALATGRLCLDKVVELVRFATPETEASLIRWAVRVSCGAIRRKADLERNESASRSGGPNDPAPCVGGTRMKGRDSGSRRSFQPIRACSSRGLVPPGRLDGGVAGGGRI